jgi:peptide/nickel transport system substrate-binding protein
MFVLLSLAACAAPAEPVPDEAQESAQSASALADAETAGKSIDASGPSGTLRHGALIAVAHWDPHREQRNVMQIYFQTVYDTLIAEAPDGTLVPGLAVEWTHTPTAVEFTLRDDVVFHDGTPFTAESVEANLTRAKNSKFPPVVNALAAIDTIEVADATHTRLNLAHPDPAMLRTLARFPGMMICPSAFESVNDAPCGTGPWMLNPDETVVESKYVFDLFEDFWDPSQQGVARIEIFNLPEAAARANGLRTGELNSVHIPVRAIVTQLEAEGFAVHTAEAFQIALHILDREGTMVPALADERVRRAMQHAIDREAFFATTSMGVPSTQRYLPGSPYYSAEIEDLSYDPEKAKTLLAEASFETIEFSVPSIGPFNAEIQAIAGFLAEVGITMHVEAAPPGSLLAEAATGNWPAAVLAVNETHPYTFIRNRVLDGYLNPFGVVDADLAKLAEEAMQLSEEEAAPLWAEIIKAAHERGYIINIGSAHDAVVTDSQVQGVAARWFYPGVLAVRGVTVGE